MPADSALTAETPHADSTRPSTWRQNALLAAMLITLHGGIAWDAGDWVGRGLLLVHLGLFLLWQPVWRGERQVPPALAAMVLALGAAFAYAGNWWLIGTWIALLFGLIGGSVPGRAGRRDRSVAILAAVYLITMLLLWVVPQVFFNYQAEAGVIAFVRYGMLALPLAILVIPGDRRSQREPVIIDLFYSILLFTLVVILVLGSFVVREVTRGDYLFGLAQTLMVVALVLVALSWMWNPRAGFGGIGLLVSQYLLGLGLPFEQRMRRLAELAGSEPQPEQFLHKALTYLLDMRWVSGFSWVTPLSVGEVGQEDVHAEPYEFGRLRIILFAPRPLSPAVLLHMKLLMQMVGHFYDALHREQQRQRAAYVQAIYETGARLTHDVKNLLQSLRSICAAADMRGAEDEVAFRALVQRQLPQITQRLGATLDKLKSPATVDTRTVDAAIWWSALQARHAHRGIVFEEGADIQGGKVPVELFDSIADTLIENAVYKTAETGKAAPVAPVRVRVTLAAGPRLRVVDDGAAVPAALAAQLLRGPVPSDSGLGVGLFQAARFAAQSGYRLTLAENRDGAVRFELRPAERASQGE